MAEKIEETDEVRGGDPSESPLPTEDEVVDVDSTGKNYWQNRTRPELVPTLQGIPTFLHTPSFDSWLKRTLLQAVMVLPGPSVKGVKMEKIPVGTLFSPIDDDILNDASSILSDTSALLWIHGGGRIAGSCRGALDTALCSKIAKLLGISVLSVSYRLAPKHAFPHALDDLADAYRWLVNHLKTTSSSGGDKIRIIVAGESAGAGLAAELCQRILDESTHIVRADVVPMPVAQILLSAMLDDRTCVNETISKLPPHLFWTNSSNTYGWSSYLGSKYKPGDENLPRYASASRREDLSNLPPAFIMCGDIDLFHGECKNYSNRLKDCGVDCEFMEVEGGFHGFFGTSTLDTVHFGKDEPPIVGKIWDRFVSFAKKHLHE